MPKAYQTFLPGDFPKVARKGKRVDREGPILRQCVYWLRIQFPGGLVHHSPNERLGRGRDAAREVSKHKLNGMLPGYPDLIWHYPHIRNRMMWIEVKASGGRLSRAQKEIRDWAEVNEIAWACVQSLEELQEAVWAEINLAKAEKDLQK